nr:immunoglobulin heavy chain junction region [Macaca mulatta]
CARQVYDTRYLDYW